MSDDPSNADNQTPRAAASADARADSPASAPAARHTRQNTAKRKRLLLMITLVVAVVGLGYSVWWFLVGSHYQSTDDAYVAGNVVQVTPQVAGTVVAIKADDTDIVKQGQELVILDSSDARVALDQAEAQLAQTVREVRNVFANNGTLSANIATRQADTIKARAALERATDDYKRRAALVVSGAVSKEELQHVETELDSAKSALAAADAGVRAAKEQLLSNQTLTDGTSVAQHPNVLRAASKVREAYLALERGTLPSPVAGQVAKRAVQLGQRVSPGTPLMAIVALDQLWVDANFKEVQLRKMRIGQPVALEADLYGGKVEYTGTIVGLSAGTGSAFSLLPAQNATGNWIKVVQRVPVRIALDARQLAEHPLRVGLSVVAKVDIADQSGEQLASSQRAAPRMGPTYQTQAFAPDTRAADALIARVIAANLGGQQANGGNVATAGRDASTVAPAALRR